MRATIVPAMPTMPLVIALTALMIPYAAPGAATLRPAQDGTRPVAVATAPETAQEGGARAGEWYAPPVYRAAGEVASEVEGELPPPAVREDVGSLQAALDALGYDVGPVDGVMGSRTRQALSEFQAARGLPATGTPDPVTRRELRDTSAVSVAAAEAPAESRAASAAEEALRPGIVPAALHVGEESEASGPTFEPTTPEPIRGSSSAMAAAQTPREADTTVASGQAARLGAMGLAGRDVISRHGERLGSVADIAFGPDGRLAGLAVHTHGHTILASVQAFFGFGGRTVFVPWDHFEVDRRGRLVTDLRWGDFEQLPQYDLASLD